MDAKESTAIESAAINEAINYIFEHIDEDITVDDVAAHCAYSKYHFTRMFKNHTEEALYQFIRRVRLERSAWLLKVEKERSITEIGVHYGYSASNFASAFRQHLHTSPKAFRQNSEHLAEQSAFARGITLDELETAQELITIGYLDDLTVIYERKMGNYHRLADEWCDFIKKYETFADEDTLYIECTLDDPSITNEDHCMYELWQTIAPTQPVLARAADAGLLVQRIRGGKYAIYHFKGYPQFIYMVYQEIFCRWLAKTGNQLDERRIFDIYRKVRDDGYMEIDICFPLK